jgi:glycine hydroxymethyltransferase
VIAAKAVAFKVAASEEFAERQRRTLDGARALAGRLTAPDVTEAGAGVLTGGTDVHLVLVDLRHSALDGPRAVSVPRSSPRSPPPTITTSPPISCCWSAPLSRSTWQPG